MPYCLRKDVTNHLPILVGADFYDVIDASIAQADADIDAALCQRYAVPFGVATEGAPPTTTVPPEIARVSAALAAHHASRDSSPKSEVSQQAKDLLAEGNAELEKLKDGRSSVSGKSVKPQFYATSDAVNLANLALNPACNPLDGWRW